MPVRGPVALRDLDAEGLVVRHEGGQRRQALAPAAAHPHEQRVAQGRLQHPHDPAHVLDGRQEQHQLHLPLRHLVVVHEEVLEHVGQLLVAGHLLVILLPAVREIREDEGLRLHDGAPLQLEVRLHRRLQSLQEPRAVLVVHKAVLEHPLALVRPAPDEVLWALEGLLCAQAQALIHLRQIPQVEGVVGFRGRGQHLGRDRLVDLDRGLHERGPLVADAARELAQEPLHDGRVDSLQAVLLEWHDEDVVEVPLVPRRDVWAPSSGGAHRADERQVHQRAELGSLALVPAARVHPLPQQLDRRLRAVRLLGWHVQVVDEDEAAPPERRPVGALPPLVQLPVDDVLSLVGAGLGAESQRDGVEAVWVELREQLLLDDDRLPRASRSGEEHVRVAAHQRLQEERVAHRVGGGHYNRVHLRRLGDLEPDDLFGPQVPPVGLAVREVVKHRALRWDRHLRGRPGVGLGAQQAVRLLQGRLRARHQVADEAAEQLLALAVGDGAEAPDERQPEQQLQLDVLLLGADVLGLGVQGQLLPQQGQVQLQQVRDQPVLAHGHWLPDLALHHLPQGVHGVLEELLDRVRALPEALREPLAPGPEEHAPANVHLLQEDHTAAGHRRWRRYRQVLDLEHHRRHGRQLDDLAAVQAELLVLVHDGVHVLDPDCVDRTVEDEPLALLRLVPGHVAEEHGHDAVGPLARDVVEAAVQVLRRDGLRVEACLVDNLGRVHRTLVCQVRERLLQRVEGGGLAAERQADEHDAVPHHVALVELDDLLHEVRVGLAVGLVQMLRQLADQEAVVGLWQLHPGEKVAADPGVEGHVEVQKLRQIHVVDGLQHQDAFVLGRLLALQAARAHEHREDCPHAVVVVLLRGQLLRAERVRGDNLLRERPCVLVAVRVELDLCDLTIVWNHHGHRAEQRLEVVGQLGATSVARVHRDEAVARPEDRQRRALELERGPTLADRSLYGEDLLRDHAQHLGVDAVKLVEACPAARRRESLEELRHR
mmetsp:Transcript_33896/g.95223  ORF Transcript_33896/g.95223 Transcript_33896/m.95223 type:complete len:995 (+) Transcript_33896:5050-8034(+)